MNTDIRIAIGFWEHPKTLRLIRACGYEGAACLQRLWMWAAQNRPNGSLHGMDDVDIELAAGWRGEDGKLFNAVIGRWIDNEDGIYALHEWIQHNPWACGSVGRESKGRFMRMKATHKEIFNLLESKGVKELSKDFYAKITACDVSLKTIAAMLPGEYPELFDDDGKCLKESRKPKGNQEGKGKQDLGKPQSNGEGNLKQTSSKPQGDLKQTLSWALRSAQAQSPTPTPMPFPMPSPEPSILKTLKGIKDISSSELPTENPEAEAEGEDDGDEGSKKTDSAAKPDKTFAEDSDAYRVSLFLFNCIAHRKPDFKKPNLQAWARHADLMLRLDKRDLESVQKVIRWCQADTFWQSNILSTAKLREKFDQLDDRMKSNGGGNGAGKQILTASGNPKHSGFTPNSGRDYKTGSANSDPESIRKLIGDEEYERIYGKLP